MTKTKDNIWTN